MITSEQSPARPERPSVAAAMVAAGALIAQQVAGKATRDALFLSNFNVESLPPVMMASALVAIVAVIGLSGALARRSPAAVVPVAVATSAGLLLTEWGLSLSFPRAAAVLVYLHMALFGATLVSIPTRRSAWWAASAWAPPWAEWQGDCSPWVCRD